MIKGEGRGSVLFVAPSAYTLSGLATWLDYIEPGLRDLGWEVTIGLVAGPRHHRPDDYLTAHPHANWLAIDCQTGTPEGRMRAIGRAIDHVEPDLVLTVNLPDAVLGAARARQRSRARLKIAMTVHGIQPDLYEDIRAHASWLDQVFCTNRLACQLANRLGGLDVSRIGHVPCGVSYAGPVSRSAPHQPIRIAFVGRLEQDQKRVLDLPPILANLEALHVPYELLIAGTGPEESGLKSALAGAMANGQAHFLGFLSPTELERLVLEQADVLLLTSSWETGPLVIWEAMAKGVIVVSSDYVGSGQEAALRHEKNALLFPVGDCQAAAMQLRRLSEDDALCARLRTASFQLIESRYSIPVSVANWDRHLCALRARPLMSPGPKIGAQAATGRLDRWLGAKWAEDIRSRRGRTPPDGGPGGEWPHSYGTTDYGDDAFWALAKALDQTDQEQAGQ